MNPEEEIYDVVDAEDRVIGQATRREIHARALLHRSVHTFVFDPQGNLFLQKRAETKDENPGYWDSSSAGHVDAGEDYPAAAQRELMEELGIREALTPFTRIAACDATFGEHVTAYTCTTCQKLTLDPQEISEGRYWHPDAIETALAEQTHPFTSTFKLLFFHYLSQKRGSGQKK